MCKPEGTVKKQEQAMVTTTTTTTRIRRRSKREKQEHGQPLLVSTPSVTKPRMMTVSKALQKHGGDAPSGGVQALFPSLIGLSILVCGVMAKMGFRGRASVAGIDLGTTNSVICVQAPAKGVGFIECIVDPATNSPIVPSVVSFLEPDERPIGPSSKTPSLLYPHPSAVVVGHAAKKRINSHPHHTLYNAKRVLGRPASDPAVHQLMAEVEFKIQVMEENGGDAYAKAENSNGNEGGVAFHVPESNRPIPPEQVGSYVVNHLIQITRQFLGHDNVKSAVICVPAKFDPRQRQQTYKAFKDAGITVARVLEEPTAAALAYGLHRKEGVDYILVYDFGGGTLDVSLLHVSDGFVDVMGSDGDDRLGGADFDAAVAHFLMEQHGQQDVIERVHTVVQRLEEKMPPAKNMDFEQTLAHDCPALAETPLCTTSSFHTIGEQLKIALSAFPDGNGHVQASCLGLGSGQDGQEETLEMIANLKSFCDSLQPVTLELTSEEYNTAVRPLLDRSVLPVKRLLADLDLTEHDMDEVVMVGGTSRMPQIRELVKQVLPSATLNTHIDPDITVAYGAASVID